MAGNRPEIRKRRLRPVKPPAPVIPVEDAGPPLRPQQVIQAIRFAADLSPEEIVTAIHAGAATARERWPDLGVADVAELQRQCALVTKSRLQAWATPKHASAPSWLVVRALISGLHHILE